MVKKKGKSVSFDAMVKFFLQHYNIPTKKDIDRLVTRIDRMEKLLKKTSSTKFAVAYSGKDSLKRGRSGMTASDMVLNVIKGAKKGAGFSDIQAKTGFDDKKLRNIIFRLNKLERIKRINRGLYIVP